MVLKTESVRPTSLSYAVQLNLSSTPTTVINSVHLCGRKCTVKRPGSRCTDSSRFIVEGDSDKCYPTLRIF